MIEPELTGKAHKIHKHSPCNFDQGQSSTVFSRDWSTGLYWWLGARRSLLWYSLMMLNGNGPFVFPQCLQQSQLKCLYETCTQRFFFSKKHWAKFIIYTPWAKFNEIIKTKQKLFLGAAADSFLIQTTEENQDYFSRREVHASFHAIIWSNAAPLISRDIHTLSYKVKGTAVALIRRNRRKY